MRAIPIRILSVMAVLVAILSVQAGASFGKHIFPIIGAEGTTALRQTFASILLLAIFQPWRNAPKSSDWPLLCVYGTLIGVMNLTFYLGIARVPLAVGVAIEFLGPLAVALMASRRLSDFLWIGCAVAGLALLLPIGGTGQALDPVGIGFCLVAAVCWASYILISQKVGTRFEAGKAVAIGMTLSTIFILPLGMMHAGMNLWMPEVLPWGIAVAVLSSAIPYSLEMLALKHVPAKTFSLMMSLHPAAAALLAFIILGEHLTSIQWLAIGLVITASAGSSLFAKRPKQEATP